MLLRPGPTRRAAGCPRSSVADARARAISVPPQLIALLLLILLLLSLPAKKPGSCPVPDCKGVLGGKLGARPGGVVGRLSAAPRLYGSGRRADALWRAALDDCGVCGGFNKDKGCDVRAAALQRARRPRAHAASRCSVAGRVLQRQDAGQGGRLLPAERPRLQRAVLQRDVLLLGACAGCCACATHLQRRAAHAVAAPGAAAARAAAAAAGDDADRPHDAHDAAAVFAAVAAVLRTAAAAAERLPALCVPRLLCAAFMHAAHAPRLTDAPPTRTAAQSQGNGGSSPWWSG